MSDRRSAKREAHELVANLIEWAVDANQGDDVQELLDRHGPVAITVLQELEDYHRRLAMGPVRPDGSNHG